MNRLYYDYNWASGKTYKKLWEIIQPCKEYDSLYQQHDEECAKQELVQFFEQFQKLEPDKKLHLGVRTGYYSFLMNMIPLQVALNEKKYSLACHELLTIHHYEPILQRRIYYNLLLLYKNYLKD